MPETDIPADENYLLAQSPVQSSQATGWSGILIDEFVLESAEMELPPFAEHSLCFNLGQPIQLLQEQNGRVREAQSGSGELSITPAGVSSRWWWDRDARILLVRLKPDFIHQVAIDLDLSNISQLEIAENFGTYDDRALGLAKLLLAESQSNDMGMQLYGESLATALAVNVLRQYSSTSQQVRPTSGCLGGSDIQQVTDYIRDNLAADLSLRQLGTVARVSPNYFATLFKQATGMSPHQYVIRCRVERAKQLLLKRDKLSVVDVAARVGFSDQSHLCRHMRRLLGITPTQLRKQS